jgi:hypothetical protein
MEMRAALEALRAANDGESLCIATDSQDVIGWLTYEFAVSKEHLRKLAVEFWTLRDRKHITVLFKKVIAHNNDPQNSAVDHEAKRQAGMISSSAHIRTPLDFSIENVKYIIEQVRDLRQRENDEDTTGPDTLKFINLLREQLIRQQDDSAQRKGGHLRETITGVPLGEAEQWLRALVAAYWSIQSLDVHVKAMERNPYVIWAVKTDEVASFNAIFYTSGKLALDGICLKNAVDRMSGC